MGAAVRAAAGAAAKRLVWWQLAGFAKSEALLSLGVGEGHGSGREDSANSGSAAAQPIGDALLSPAGGAPAAGPLLPGLGDVEQQDQGDSEDRQEGGEDAEGGGHGWCREVVKVVPG